MIITQSFSVKGKDEPQCKQVAKALNQIQNAFTSEELIELGEKLTNKESVNKIRNFKHLL
jgi:hypothetical protein